MAYGRGEIMTGVGIPLLKKLVNIWQEIVLWLHRRRLTAAVSSGDREYQSYLDGQLTRTLSKRTDILPVRVRDFIDRISNLVELGNYRILCVGCRNTLEIEYFRNKGAKEVIGIDLYSESPSVTVMDMHAMLFGDNTFDLVFSSHSLEHAYDPGQAVAEFLRVVVPGGIIAVEVPICFKPSGADLVDFGDVEQLHRLFASCLERILWTEELMPPTDVLGTATMRSVFVVGPKKT
jgi:SAM-dependent methyltransferase